MATIEGPAEAMLRDKNFAHVSTLREDGTVHNAVIWIDVEDGHVIVNSAEGRAWPKNVRRDPRVTLSVHSQENPYEYVEVRGRVVDEIKGDDADRNIDALAKKYMGVDEYPLRKPGEERIKFLIEPDRVRHQSAG